MWDKLEELDIFDWEKKIGIKDATPAMALQKILMDKWTLQEEDKDMIVMYHKFGYELEGKKKQIDSNMVIKGEDQTYTAMAKTVGLPVAIAALKYSIRKSPLPVSCALSPRKSMSPSSKNSRTLVFPSKNTLPITWVITRIM